MNALVHHLLPWVLTATRLTTACAQPSAHLQLSHPPYAQSETVAMDELAQRLLNLGYENLFMRLDYSTLNELWQEPELPQRLEQLASDPTSPPQARFLAAEILFHQQTSYPPDRETANLAQVYATALADAKIGNPWGLPGQVGQPAGRHLLQLGQPAVAPLMALLDDTRSVPYAGSREATFGNRYHYRVKDLAAFYISQLCQLPYTVHQTPEERDREIEQLQSQVCAE